MTDKERIELLEKQVQELKALVGTKGRTIVEWRNMSVYLDERIKEIFKDPYKANQFKTSLTTLISKSFRKNTVMAMTREDIEEAKPFIEYVLNFAKEKRDKYEKKDAVSGYELTLRGNK